MGSKRAQCFMNGALKRAIITITLSKRDYLSPLNTSPSMCVPLEGTEHTISGMN